MKTKPIQLISLLAVLCLVPAALLAQSFSSGSTGAYGALNITADTTLDMPADGIFHCTTINIAASKTLRFRRNALNTPVYLLATGDITIAGTIDISGGRGTYFGGGEGGPGGFDGGNPPDGSGNPASAGQGPGGGKGGTGSTDNTSGVGSGSYRTVSPSYPSRTKNGVTYGNSLLFPIVGGSGGGGSSGDGGSGGGGAILVASSTRIDVTGRINASSGHFSQLNEGSGGAIRLIAPLVSGGGQLDIYSNGHGGYGRSRVDTLDRRSLGLGGIISAGSLMVVFPSPLPKLAITNAAGTAIAEGAAGPVNITLPFGSSPNQTVTIRARDFSGQVPIRVVLTPEYGDPLTYDATIDNAANNPAEATVNVVMPINRLVKVNAWTR